jgi:alpha-N-arabinofuranosidase
MSEAKLILNADLGQHTISRHIYGHFSEHLGRCIYDGLYVGEDSSIPNTRGMRDDIVAALRSIGIPNLRWPGGCFADEYHWMDGIGPKAERPGIYNSHWGGVIENNHFGTHEFMELCAQLGCEPYICGNVGSGTVREMQQWVEYISNTGGPMAEQRRKNGRPDPWHLTYWGVGNENWGCGGRMRPEYYADLYRQYATYVRNIGENKIYKIACGPNSGNYHWTEVLMREAGALMHGLALHYYTRVRKPEGLGSATVFDEADWMACLKNGLFMEELVTRHSTIMDMYDPEKRVALVVDEWGTWHAVEPGTNPGFLYQQNTLRDALVAGLTLNIFNQHADRVRIGCIAQTINVLQAMILTDGARMLLTPTYHVFEMFKVHHDATLLPIEIDAPDYTLGADSIPALSASASRDAQGAVHITLCNTDPHNSLKLACALRGNTATQVSGRVLTADTMQAHNTFDAPETIQPTALKGLSLQGDTLTVTLPSKSVAVITLS